MEERGGGEEARFVRWLNLFFFLSFKGILAAVVGAESHRYRAFVINQASSVKPHRLCIACSLGYSCCLSDSDRLLRAFFMYLLSVRRLFCCQMYQWGGPDSFLLFPSLICFSVYFNGLFLYSSQCCRSDPGVRNKLGPLALMRKIK